MTCSYRFTVTQSVGNEYFQMSELALKTIAAHTHNYVDGICTVCGQIDPAAMTLNAEGVYELSTALQLKLWGKMIEKTVSMPSKPN